MDIIIQLMLPDDNFLDNIFCPKAEKLVKTSETDSKINLFNFLENFKASHQYLNKLDSKAESLVFDTPKNAQAFFPVQKNSFRPIVKS